MIGECPHHPSAATEDCRADECNGRRICLAPVPHHLDQDPIPLQQEWMTYQLDLRAQLDTWYDHYADLPLRGRIRCPACKHGCHVRWRSTKDAIKVTCFVCGLEADCGTRPDWLQARGPFGQQWLPGDRVHIVGGIWNRLPAEPPSGVVISIRRNEAYLDDGPIRPVVSVRFDDPVYGTAQDWLPNQLELRPWPPETDPQPLSRGPLRQRWRVGDLVAVAGMKPVRQGVVTGIHPDAEVAWHSASHAKIFVAFTGVEGQPTERVFTAGQLRRASRNKRG